MSLQLPPERRLTDKAVRADWILSDTEPTDTESIDLGGRRRRRISYALAAAVAVIIGGLGIGYLARPSEPGVSGPAPTTAPSLTSPHSSPSRPADPDPSTLRIGEQTELDYFTVTVLETSQTSAGFAAEVRTCLTGTPPNYESDSIPIGWYPWRAITDRNSYQANVEDLSDPEFTPVYPSGKRFAEGECVKGWLPFEAIGADEHVSELTYSNDYGGEARWRVE